MNGFRVFNFILLIFKFTLLIQMQSDGIYSHQNNNDCRSWLLETMHAEISTCQTIVFFHELS